LQGVDRAYTLKRFAYNGDLDAGAIYREHSADFPVRNECPPGCVCMRASVCWPMPSSAPAPSRSEVAPNFVDRQLGAAADWLGLGAPEVLAIIKSLAVLAVEVIVLQLGRLD
jgi:hypothetical protein